MGVGTGVEVGADVGVSVGVVVGVAVGAANGVGVGGAVGAGMGDGMLVGVGAAVGAGVAVGGVEQAARVARTRAKRHTVAIDRIGEPPREKGCGNANIIFSLQEWQIQLGFVSFAKVLPKPPHLLITLVKIRAHSWIKSTALPISPKTRYSYPKRLPYSVLGRQRYGRNTWPWPYPFSFLD